MNREMVSGIMLSLLLIGIATLAFNIQLANAESTTIIVPDDNPTIQEAINVANAGDVIIVREGTYIENVKVNKDHLTIKSENGADGTIVQAANPDDHGFEITADYVSLSGFTVKGTPHWFGAGIRLVGSLHCNISDNMSPDRIATVSL